MFLPANTTSILQPMDQGSLEALKRRYKKRLLRHLIIENESSSLSIPEILKKLTIKDAVYWSAQAWEDASPISLSNSWNKLLQTAVTSQASPSSSATEVTSQASSSGSATETASAEDISAASGNMPQADGATDVADFNHLFRSLGYADNDPNWTNPQDWLMEDGSDPGYHLMSDQEIIETVMQEREDSDSEDEDPSPPPTVTHS